MATAKKKTVKKKSPAKKAIAKVEKDLPAVVETQSTQIMNSITDALAKGIDADAIDKLAKIHERMLDRESQQAYTNAMVAVQTDLPDIKKGEYNDHTKSTYESLEAMNRAIKPIYTGHGFSISFGTEKGDDADMIVVTADVMHRGGHKEHYVYPLPYDALGIKGNTNKTKIHASGSTLTYGRRYLLKLIFNLTTADDVDDDANKAGEIGAEPVLMISESQIADLRALMDETDVTEEQFLKIAKHDSLDEIPADRFNAAIGMLERKRDMQ